MTNNVKSCKKSMEELKLPDSVFLQGDDRSSVLDTLKTTKTRKTKTPPIFDDEAVFSNSLNFGGL